MSILGVTENSILILHTQLIAASNLAAITNKPAVESDAQNCEVIT